MSAMLDTYALRRIFGRIRMRILFVLAWVVTAIPSAAGQTQPELEVVSIKPNHSVRQSTGNRFDPQRMSWTNVSLQVLIETAYNIRPYQVAGVPAWAGSERWDIEA